MRKLYSPDSTLSRIAGSALLLVVLVWMLIDDSRTIFVAIWIWTMSMVIWVSSVRWRAFIRIAATAMLVVQRTYFGIHQGHLGPQLMFACIAIAVCAWLNYWELTQDRGGPISSNQSESL